MAKYHREGHMKDERMVELVKNHIDITISHDLSDWSNVDCRVYSETTADGYDLFVVTQNLDHPIICEDCYQYDHDLADALPWWVPGGDDGRCDHRDPIRRADQVGSGGRIPGDPVRRVRAGPREGPSVERARGGGRRRPARAARGCGGAGAGDA